MNLDALINEATSRGRKSVPMHATVARTLTVEDLQELADGGNSAPIPTVKELHASHHKLAQVLAKGSRPQEASAITGYSTARIQQLQADPQFQELLNYYKELDQNSWVDFQTVIRERLAALSLDTIEATHRRLLDKPDSFSAKELAAVAELGLDRIGHGKQNTTQVDHTLRVDEEQLARLRAVKDSPAQITPEDRAALVGLALFATEGDSPAEAASRVEGSGSVLREEGRQGTSEAAGTIIDLPSVGGMDTA